VAWDLKALARPDGAGFAMAFREYTPPFKRNADGTLSLPPAAKLMVMVQNPSGFNSRTVATDVYALLTQ
jgi:hypothetical protein